MLGAERDAGAARSACRRCIVTPIASGRRRFGPLVGDERRDGRALGRRHPRPESDLAGDLRQRRRGDGRHGARRRRLRRRRRPARASAITMLGKTTKAVMTIARRAGRGRPSSRVIFHSNGVGGPAMEELARGRRCSRASSTSRPTSSPTSWSAASTRPARSGCAGSAGSGCRRSSCPAASTSPSTGGPRQCRRAAGPARATIHNPGVHAGADRRATRWRSSDGSSPSGSNEAHGPGRVMVADARALDPRRPGRRLLGSGRRRRASSTRCARALRADIPVRPIDAHINDDRVRRRRRRALPGAPRPKETRRMTVPFPSSCRRTTWPTCAYPDIAWLT